MSKQVGRNEAATRVPVDRLAMVKAPPLNPPKHRARPVVEPQVSARKQPGRRYGPPPKREPGPQMQAPAPMSNARRAEVYGRRQERTMRQQRQYKRMLSRSLHRIGGSDVA